jgi:hypothetical protein
MINENIADFAYLQSPFFSSSISFFFKTSLCSCFNFIIYCSASHIQRDVGIATMTVPERKEIVRKR